MINRYSICLIIGLFISEKCFSMFLSNKCMDIHNDPPIYIKCCFVWFLFYILFLAVFGGLASKFIYGYVLIHYHSFPTIFYNFSSFGALIGGIIYAYILSFSVSLPIFATLFICGASVLPLLAMIRFGSFWQKEITGCCVSSTRINSWLGYDYHPVMLYEALLLSILSIIMLHNHSKNDFMNIFKLLSIYILIFMVRAFITEPLKVETHSTLWITNSFLFVYLVCSLLLWTILAYKYIISQYNKS